MWDSLVDRSQLRRVGTLDVSALIINRKAKLLDSTCLSAWCDGDSHIAVFNAVESVRRGVVSMVQDLRASMDSGGAFVDGHVETDNEVIPHCFTYELCEVVLQNQDEAARARDMTAIAAVFVRVLQSTAAPQGDPEWRDYFENLLWVSWFESFEGNAGVLAAFLAVSGPLVQEQHAQFAREWERFRAKVRKDSGGDPQ